MIIGIAGKKKSGKDTIAKHLEVTYGFKIYHYADAMKEFCRDYLGLEERLLWGTDDDKATLSQYKKKDLYNIANSIIASRPHVEYDIYGDFTDEAIAEPNKFMSYREILQYFGTEVFRAFDPDFHIKNLFRRIKKDNVKDVVVADIRYQNEITPIENEGGFVLRLTRTQLKKDNHTSETSLDNYPFKYVIDNQNQTLQETFRDVTHLMRNVWNWKM